MLLSLFLRPVFLFNGDTPVLNRRMIIQKTVEKFLLNHRRARKLDDLVWLIPNPKYNEIYSMIGLVSNVEASRY